MADKLAVKIGGRPYRPTPLDEAAAEKFERWMIGRAVAHIANESRGQPEEVKVGLTAQLLADVEAGEFKASSARGRSEMRTTEGTLFNLGLILRPNHPDLTDDDLLAMITDHVGDLVQMMLLVHAGELARKE